ncbi:MULTISPECIES: type IV pilus modification protein PilV [unclassified Lysobacter]|uniref:type IV pilus modification protein PilV n=1 Tax=unclassified Lysobacter TaxID=2635362 RepID=UPI001BEBEBE8|nr:MULTISPECIES: type IV pilus modification protein PilV [unclassified Lysobacter]MBT2745420.1 type IV pilus modification protein PilV [Lysobacter sp. ISL-42]MBT2776962.1 type IV pilus modification protein PilV [Lysobacter sp. ISL-54]MBT2781482.1 type IV pilus modification protein PilV [Lysobacter sp. ISL-52]
MRLNIARTSGGRRTARQRGFSLIEVLISMLVIGFGLLGLAMMQTLSVRYSQSANYRTQANNLAYDLLDQIRANRALSAQFTKIDQASFASVTGKSCSRLVDTYLSPEDSATRWKCQVRATLGGGAYAVVSKSGTQTSVTISWSDARGVVGAVGDNFNGRVSVGTDL